MVGLSRIESCLTSLGKFLEAIFGFFASLFLENSSTTQAVIEDVRKIPEVTVAHLTTGKFSIFCKIRAKDTMHAKEIIFELDRIEGIKRTETSISLEEVINDKKRLMHHIFKEITF